MRLTPHEIAAIKAAAAHAFGPEATVRLFGSRVDDARRGGDIDLHVEASADADPFKTMCDFKWELFSRIEERQVDVVVQPNGLADRDIDRVAKFHGIVL